MGSKPHTYTHTICMCMCGSLPTHYNDVIMGAIASQITSLTIVYSTISSRRRSKETSKSRVTGLCAGNSPVTGEFPTQMASNAANVSIWWRHNRWYPYLWRLLHRHCHKRLLKFRGSNPWVYVWIYRTNLLRINYITTTTEAQQNRLHIYRGLNWISYWKYRTNNFF